MTERTLTLAEIIKNAIRSELLDTHTCIPAIIEKYDRNKQVASVQPSIKRKYIGDKIVNLPIIQNVPVQFPKGDGFFMHYDLKKGDNVILIFSERSLDNWYKKGGLVEANDPRIHSISDAFAIPGGSAEPDVFTPLGPIGSLELTNSDSSIILSSDGKLSINNAESEVISLMVDLLDAMISGKNLTTGGPLGKDPQYLQSLNEIKAKMEGFKI